MNNKNSFIFTETPVRFLTDSLNAKALRTWNYLIDVYEGQDLDIRLSKDLLEGYCDNNQKIELIIESLSKNMKERVNIFQDIPELQTLGTYINIQKTLARSLSLPKALKNYERRKGKSKTKIT